MASPKKSALSLALGFAMIFSVAAQAAAQTKINLLYTAGNNFAAAYVAKDQGYFAKRGVDIDLSLAQNAGVILPAVWSGTAQIGAPTVSTLLQAIDQGLDFVVIAGSNVKTENAPVQAGFVARAGSGIKEANDLIGKKIGESSFGGTLDLLTRRWVAVHGANPARMQWVEIPFPQMSDALKSGIADAVTVVDPFYTRIIGAQIGERIGDVTSVQTAGTSLSAFVTTRAWAKENATTIRAFRDALDEAVTYIGKTENRASVLESIVKWTKLPPPAAATATIPEGLEVHAKPSSLTFWIELCKEQGLIKSNPNPASLIAP